ncbi:MAG: hypothetical protein KDK08_05775 [Rhizobiaceae bacterium]|mgnify:CR=1 FL=1|nr:hypothetical protein [Rhizobiaceae bacterium]MCC0000969.1 hypothetical protein [Methylobacteriaceae bacterium]
MPKFETTAEFYHGNEMIPVGATVDLSEAQAKYRRHHLVEIKAEALAPAVDTDLDEGPARDEKRHRKAKAEKPVVAEKADADGDA